MNVFRARRTLVWGVLSLLLGAALLLSLTLAREAVGGAERAAQRRAEDYTNTVLYKALTPALVNKPMEGRDYGDILIQVQAGILVDDDVVRVRIWNAAGQLVFSSDQRDRLGQEAGSGGILGRVLDGATVSVATGARVAPQPGLAGSNEQLLRSYVSLRLGDQTSASATAEIDQRYSAILASAHAVWRPVQIAIGVGLLAALAMLVTSIRGSSAGSRFGAAGDPRAAERARTLERQLKELEKRVKDADDRTREAVDRADAMSNAKSALEQQLANSERNLRETLTAGRSDEDGAATLAARVPDLERELAELRARVAAAESIVPGVSAEELATAQARAREAETERDRLAHETERLNVAMSDNGAALARARELEARMAELQRTGPDADARVTEARARATAAEQQLAEVDARATEADARATEAERRFAELEQRAKSTVDRTQSDLDRLSVRLSETQAAVAESTDKLTHLQTELERVQQEKSDAVAELQRAGLATRERDREVEGLRAAIAERDVQLQQFQETILERNAELEQLRGGLRERSGEAEHAWAETAAKAAELEQLRAEAIAKNAELDALRIEADARTAELEQLRWSANSGSTEIETLRARVAELEVANSDVAQGDTELDQQQAVLRSNEEELAQLREVEGLEERGRKFAATAVDASLGNGSNGSTPDAEHGLFAEPTSSRSPVFEPPEEVTVGSRLAAFRKRRQSPWLEEASPLREQWQAPAVHETYEPESEREPPMTEIGPEGLSLRERLTRAAAARHRVSAPSDRDEG